MKSDRGGGYTLVELLVAMLIFAVVMALMSASFARIIRNTSQLGKTVETDIGGLIGLELMRIDTELAGFGLPWSVPAWLNYVEAQKGSMVSGCADGCPGADASKYNDRPYLDAPPAYRVGSNVGLNGSDYLVLKGTPLGANSVCRGWCFLNYSSVTRSSLVEPKLTDSKARCIVLRAGTSAGRPTRDLVTDSGHFTLILGNAVPPGFAPAERTDSNLVYGVAPDGAELSFPFNRSDYYISRGPHISALCNKGTGTLYKTVINHGGKGPTSYPVLDCVADMQVVLYLDTDGDGEIDYHPGDEVDGLNAEELREQLKEIRVYILAQQGGKDTSYLYPVTDPFRAIVVGDPEVSDPVAQGRVWNVAALEATFGPNWRNYRWKLYTIVVRPKNL